MQIKFYFSLRAGKDGRKKEGGKKNGEVEGGKEVDYSLQTGEKYIYPGLAA